MTLSQAVWAERVATAAGLPDERLRKRMATILIENLEHPQASIPQATGSADEAKATYRFYANRRVTAPDLRRGIRLEAARRPGLHDILSRTLRQGFDADVAFNANAGLPGGAEEIRLLHFAIDGLMLDQLTPGTGRPYDVDSITERLVRRLNRED